MGALVHVATDSASGLRDRVWPSGKPGYGTIYDAKQLELLWPKNTGVLDDLKDTELLGLLQAYGLLGRIPGPSEGGLESAFLLPFAVPFESQLPAHSRKTMSEFFQSPHPTVSRAFELVQDSAKIPDWSGVSGRVVVQLLKRDEAKNVVVSREKFLLTMADAFVFGQIEPARITISVASSIVGGRHVHLYNFLETGCSAVRSALNELDCDFNERVLCPLCLRESPQTVESWAYDLANRRLACLTANCAHRAENRLCVGDMHKASQGVTQSVCHHDLRLLPLWLLLGLSPARDVNVAEVEKAWAEAKPVFFGNAQFLDVFR